MKKILIALCVLSISMQYSFSQTHVVMVKKGDLWGYMGDNGEWVIEPQYTTCFPFSEGFAAVYNKAKREHYFVDSNNERQLSQESPYLLKSGGTFSDGMIPVLKGKQYGVSDNAGELAVPFEYSKIYPFYNGLAIAKKGKTFYIIDKAGRATQIDGAIDVKHFSEGKAPYRAADKKFGFIGKDGKIAIPAKFRSVGYFSAGVAWAKTADGSVGFIDHEGNWVIEPKFKAVKAFSQGYMKLALVKEQDTWQYIVLGEEEQAVVIPGADKFWSFNDGLARVVKNGNFGFIDPSGEWAIEAKFDGARDFKNGFAAVKTGTLWGIINTSGNWIIEPSFQGIKDMEPMN
jgi:hypothetical protein